MNLWEKNQFERPIGEVDNQILKDILAYILLFVNKKYLFEVVIVGCLVGGGGGEVGMAIIVGKLAIGSSLLQ